ncbi:hypothetical protein JCGZ_09099 [Jatropha curcas]|uniref:Uncharacterized protein n=1 Tax=Jatropha curcas TaxID=180498 RepID=A0A067KHF5_JATCU|nr:hypothetical protein JCGZ_09099 [Jatropha curcas]
MAELLQRGPAARWRYVAELVLVARVSAGAVGTRHRHNRREEERERKKRKGRRRRRRRRRNERKAVVLGGWSGGARLSE